MKINQVLVEATGATVAFAFGRFNPAHQGHIEVWRAVEDAGANWFIGTNPSTLGPNDPLTFQQKSAWMEEIYPPIAGHIVPEQSVLTLASYIFKKLRKNENATVAYITDAQDWAWSGKLLNQYNGVEGAHGYYKFAQIIHEPSPRVSSATDLRNAARADDKVAFYHASGTDPKAKVAGKTYFDTVKEACAKYPVPVKRGQKVKEQAVAEVSTELRNRYVTRASDDYGFANFAARASKDHPGLDDYSQEQEQRAKKRAAGLNRALSDKRLGREESVAESNPNQQLSVWHPETKTYKGTKNKIPTSDYAGDNDITTNYKKVDNFKHSEVNPLHKGDDSIEKAERNVNREQLTKLVKAAFNILTPEEKEVLNYRFWHDMTLDSIAQKMSISGPRVRQIEAQAFRKLKKASNLSPVGESTEQKTVAKTWDQMTSQEKLSGVKGRTVWNERTQRYYTVFDVPVKQATDEASLATMRDYFAGDENARDPYEITKQRLHFAKDKDAKPTTKKEFRSQWEYEQWLKQNKLKQISGVQEDEEAGEVEKTGQLIPFPQGTTKVAVSDVYDWYKLGQVISDLDDADPAQFGQGAPETVIAFGSEEEEHKLLPLLKRLGLKLKDIDQPVREAYHAGSLYNMLNKRK